jgi:hypothetical protein
LDAEAGERELSDMPASVGGGKLNQSIRETVG